MILDTLYKRTKTGAIQYWKILVQLAATNSDASIQKESGQFGTTSPTKHVEWVTKGKNLGRSNETSPLEQAELQARSDWQKKKDEGYKSLTDLDIVCRDEELGLALEAALPQFNTDANGNAKPMKAPTKPWAAGKKLVFPYLYEPKLDGNRCFMAREADGTKFYSSGGKPFDTLAHLAAVIDTLPDGAIPDLLDGELYCHGMTLQQINSAAKAFKPSSLKLKFHIFDVPGLNEVQTVRSEVAKQASITINNPLFPVLDSVLIHSSDEILPHHDRWVDLGYEGGMLKHPDGTYQFGQRSSYWCKVKMFEDAEFKTIGYELGQRGAQDLSFICECLGGTFNAAMNGSIKDKEEIAENIEQYIGKQLTVKFFGLTEAGIPNLPKGKAFRDYE